MKKNNVSSLKEQSSDKVQTSLFHEVANQPEARQWVEQVRVANKQLNQSLFSSVEYDGDAFIPSGTTILYFLRINKYLFNFIIFNTIM